MCDPPVTRVADIWSRWISVSRQVAFSQGQVDFQICLPSEQGDFSDLVTVVSQYTPYISESDVSTLVMIKF